MKQVNVPLLLLVWTILAVVAAGGCGGKQSSEFIPIYPDIASPLKQISFLTLVDDNLFAGDWGGVEFDGKNFRTLHGNGGIGFNLPEAPVSSLMLRFTAKGSSALELKLALNNTPLKTIKLKKATLGEHKVLLSKKLLSAGSNKIGIQIPEKTAVKFYSWGVTPARMLNKTKEVGNNSMITPAQLDYRLWPQQDTFAAVFDQPVKQIEITISDEAGTLDSQTLENRDKVNLDLDEWKNRLISLSLRLKDSPKIIRLKSSGIHRVPEPQADQPLEMVQEQLEQKFGQYNILVLLLDSARADRFSTYGYQRATTPNIDKLAQSSLVFTKAYAEAAYTLASTGSLFSGLAPDFHNAVSNYFGGLPSQIETLAETYKAAGYRTAAVSAIPYCGSTFNMHQGFDTFIELFKDKKQPLAEEFLPHFQRIVEDAQQNNKKFFTYLHIREPHIDFLMEPPFFGSFHEGYETYPNEPFLKRLKEIYFATGDNKDRNYSPEDIALLADSYDENLLKADHEVARLLGVLKEKKLDQSTIVVILGDHGEGLNEHRQIGHNTILFREGLHIPMIIHVPGITAAKIEVPYPVSTTDLTDTLKRFVAPGSRSPADVSFKGLFKRINRRLLIARTIFFSRFYPFYSLQEGSYRIIIPFPQSSRPTSLFDVEKDPGETDAIENQFVKEYFLFQLRNFFRHKNTFQLGPRKTTLKQSEIESLKSLGYL
jgi:arylsulfatase A-like enzyme